MSNAKKLLKARKDTGAGRAERSVPICMREDLLRQLQELQRELDEAESERRANASLNSGGESRVIAERIGATRVEMQASTIVVVLRALRRGDWNALIEAHQPREDNKEDVALGLNPETFFPAAILACKVEPTDFDSDDWAALFEECSDAEWKSLTQAVWAVNANDNHVPFSPAASRILNSDPESKQPNGSGSPRNASKAGSRRPSTSTTTTTG